MSENVLDILSTYNLQAQNDMIILNCILSAKTAFLRRKRRKHLRNIALLQKKQYTILQQLLLRNQPRQIWTKTKGSQFWEKEVAEKNDEFFKENFRMSRASFNILWKQLKNLEKVNTNYRKSIPLQKRVAIALYALGSESEYRRIAKRFGVGRSTVCNIIKNFCREVWKVLRPKYFNFQKNPLQQENCEENVKNNDSQNFDDSLLEDDTAMPLEETKLIEALKHLRSRFVRIERDLVNHGENASIVIKASCVLHNFLQKHNDNVESKWLRHQNGVSSDQKQEHVANLNAISRYLACLEFPDVSEEDAASERAGLGGIDGIVAISENV